MKRLVLILTLTIVCNWTYAAGGDMGVITNPNTDGSTTYPWLIEDFEDFQEFASNPAYWDSGVHTRLESDIDLDPNLPGRQTYHQAPIAGDPDSDTDFDGTQFEGDFDGNNYSISNLTIDGEHYAALFGKINLGGQVHNLKIIDVDISGQLFVGGLTGIITKGNLVNCLSTGHVSGDRFAGGIAGYVDWYSVVTDSFSENSVRGQYCIGSFCGSNAGEIQYCSAKGIVTGHDNASYIGGFCGANSSTISDCFATGNASGGISCYGIGGFAGENTSTETMINCYATGDVSGGDNSRYLGGLCGSNINGSIINCYSVGKVTEPIYTGGGGDSVMGGAAGGLVGMAGSTTNSFWDMDTSSLTTSSGGIGLTTIEMMTLSTFTSAGWDFSDEDGDPAVWMMLREGEDYPKLAWQTIYDGDIAGLYGVDMVDVAYLSHYWGLSDCDGADDCGRADIDASGDVGITDLAAVAEDWLLH